ncbi:hypothetical protein QFC24_005776 [Naganishia onofrii]|uniref:Uncharacterized protein n=1 Tax=Naganishia onofrii TaxID=1851511 RepID=A0ACC2X5K5_9TREE|nr:hypothetical protein QFC24_005776 [Naganishia onofrii]
MSLSSILNNTQTPHQPLLVLCDTATLPGQPVLKDLVRRNLSDNVPIAFISVLHPPSAYGLNSSSADHSNVRVLDLTDDVEVFYADDTDGKGSLGRVQTWIEESINSLGRGVQVYIDGLDILAEDYDSSSVALKIVKKTLQLIRGLKAPSRLVLLLPAHSSLLDHLVTPSISLSSTITLLSLHPPALLRHLSNTYLVPPPPSGSLDSSSDPAGLRFWSILNASDGLGTAGWSGGQAGDLKGKGKAKAEGLKFALSAEELGEDKSGLTIEIGDWAGFGTGITKSEMDATASNAGSTSSAGEGGVIVQILVRKQQGGANKGMSRTLEALRPLRSASVPWSLDSCPWYELSGMEDVGKAFGKTGKAVEPEQGDRVEQSNQEQHHPSQQHIPFNLSLTPAQQASRAQVPIPYAHEGDDAPSQQRYDTVPTGGIIFEPGSEDDMDDDDPDEDLDF